MIFSNIEQSKAMKKNTDLSWCMLGKRDVKYDIVTQGYILPHRVDDKKVYGNGGVVDCDGNYVEKSSFSLIMNTDPVIDWGGAYPFEPDCCQECDETVIFGGFINNNEWGHFIVDWSTRLWYALLVDKTSKIVLCTRENNIKLNSNIIKVMELGGIDMGRLIIIEPLSKPLFCKCIVIPEEALHRDYYSEKFFVLFRNATKAVQEMKKGTTCYEKIYLTRTKLIPQKEIGESDIEQIFRDRGYHIISPERLSVEEQIYYMSTCSEVVSIEGSAAHNIVFSIGNIKKQIILEKTRCVNRRQIFLNQIWGVKVDYIGVYPTVDLIKENKENIYIVKVSNELISYLDLSVKRKFYNIKFVCNIIKYYRLWLGKKVVRCINKLKVVVQEKK